MMMMTAGGPGRVGPIDHGERRKPLKPATWIAIGLVTAAHVGVAVALYNQRFHLDANSPPPPPERGFEVSLLRPPPPPAKPVEAPRVPPAPNAALNKTPAPALPTETLSASAADTPPDVGPISIAPPAPPEATGAVSPPTPPGPPVITDPRWLSRPDAGQLMRAYPQRALERGVSGMAALRCTVRVDGTLSGCAAISETPFGQGFGRAGVQLSRHFRMSPRTIDGQAADGAAVTFTVRFNVKD